LSKTSHSRAFCKIEEHQAFDQLPEFLGAVNTSVRRNHVPISAFLVKRKKTGYTKNNDFIEVERI